MRFCIDEDSGAVIRGWVTPDNPLAISRVAISAEGRRLAEIEASRILPALRQNGWHSTGQCEFVADEASVPGLADLAELEIHDLDTNVLVYRRTASAQLNDNKLVLVNTGIHPETEIQTALYPYFRHSYFGIAKFSEQILTSLLDPVSLRSLFMSGLIPFPRYEPHLSVGEAMSAMMVQDPFTEMAARLLWLRERAGLAADPEQRWRLGTMAEAAAFTRDYDYEDPKHLKRFLRMLPEPAYLLLYNPLTRLLGTKAPEDHLYPAISVLAVEALARIDVVGHRDHYEAFVTTLYDRLGLDAPLPVPSPIPEATRALAERLRTIKAAREFLVFDSAISEGVRRSVARSWLE